MFAKIRSSIRSIKPVTESVILATVMLWIALPKHGGFIALLCFFPWAISLPFSLWKVVFKGADKREFGIKAAVWLVSFGLVYGVHGYYHTTTRNFADDVAGKVIQYHEKHGDYPKTVEEIGITSEQMRQYGMAYFYHEPGNEPSLFYRATMIVFDTFDYDFRLRQWVYRVS